MRYCVMRVLGVFRESVWLILSVTLLGAGTLTVLDTAARAQTGCGSYDPETQGCCNGVTYVLATQGCCNMQVYDLGAKCCCASSCDESNPGPDTLSDGPCDSEDPE
jgi:hypothetical protein